MSRWIDAEYCEDFFDRWESRVKNADPVTIDVVQNTRTLLRDAPSIDIVRCKECENWQTDWVPEGCEGVEDLHYCAVVDGCKFGDFFCADGEREGE